MMKDALKKIFNSTKTITLYQYVPEENPGPKFTRLLPKEILRITEQRELVSIRQYFDIHDTSHGSIRTSGYYFFEFESITGSKTSIMYLGHGRLRCDTIWQGDATLVRPLEFLHWLAKMGVTSPLESEIAAQKRRELEQEKAAKVRAKIPLSLCHPNGRLNLSNMRKDSTELFEEVKAKSSNTDALITDLFELLVLRSNNWGETSMIEMLITKVLLGAPISLLEEVVMKTDLTPLQADGMGRFFTSTEFQQNAKIEEITLRPPVREKLHHHLKLLGDEKKLEIYEKKFI